MPRQSSLTITYGDLLQLAENVLREREGWYNGARARGTSNLEPLAHQVEVARTWVRMIRKGLPGRQTDLLELFNQTNK